MWVPYSKQKHYLKKKANGKTDYILMSILHADVSELVPVSDGCFWMWLTLRAFMIGWRLFMVQCREADWWKTLGGEEDGNALGEVNSSSLSHERPD